MFGHHISKRKLRTSSDTIQIFIPEWLDIPVNQTYKLNRAGMNYILDNPGVLAFPVNQNKGEKVIKFTIAPILTKPEYIYVRISLPSSPNNRNYGFTEFLKPGRQLKLVCPSGAVVYACDGPYWDKNNPKERQAFVVTEQLEGKVLKVNLLPSIKNEK